MYEQEAKAMVAALESKVPGRASATAGPGNNATVRYYVDGTPIVFNAIFSGGKIATQAVTEPQGGILWGVREHTVSETGVLDAVSEMVDWLGRQGAHRTAT